MSVLIFPTNLKTDNGLTTKLIIDIKPADVWAAIEEFRNIDKIHIVTITMHKKGDLVDLHATPATVLDVPSTGYDKSQLLNLAEKLTGSIKFDMTFVGKFYSHDGDIESLGSPA
jgi:hypothetical protein